jgi:hypothetical protein
VFARIERAAGAPLPVPRERVEIDAVPGELPGTIQITRDGVVVDGIDGLDDVDEFADFLKLMIEQSRNRQPPRAD